MTSSGSKNPIPFPLDDVEIRRVENITQIEDPAVSSDWIGINPTEFSMSVKDVGSFYARNGTFIEYAPDKNATPASLELYLNGSVYGAILHQRKILPLHGSSFVHNDIGVMFCGDSGAGKSSLTASFCFDGAEFLTDDVTPILFENGKPQIWPKSGRVKLWDDSIQQLSRENTELTKIRPEDEKYYVPIDTTQIEAHSLNRILILEITDTDDVSFERAEKIEAFTYLHQEIYRREYLGVMPETEVAYLEQISRICENAIITRVHRPKTISIEKMQNIISNFLESA